MRLAHWPFLILLTLIPLLHRWWLARNTPAKVTFSIPIPAEAARKSPLKILLVIKYLALFFLIIALARPQTSYRQTERNVNGIDIVMLMDFSASMSIEDLADRSRVEIAKEMMENFIKGRSNDRIGLVIFSGEPLTLAPPTLDYGLVLRALHDAQLGVLKDGTAIGDGLSVAISRLRNSTAKSKVIVLLTDGDNNLGQVDPATAGELAAGYGIRVYTIAIGKEGRVKMPIRHRGLLGNPVTSYQWFENALNPELLKQIAEKTNGKFYRVTDYDTLESVFKEIDQLEKTEVKATEKVKYDDVFQKPLKLGLFLLFLGQLLERVWWRVLL
ncbi:VWA domain-containing protein [Bdellovibrionota bacterium FG-1]